MAGNEPLRSAARMRHDVTTLHRKSINNPHRFFAHSPPRSSGLLVPHGPKALRRPAPAKQRTPNEKVIPHDNRRPRAHRQRSRAMSLKVSGRVEFGEFLRFRFAVYSSRWSKSALYIVYSIRSFGSFRASSFPVGSRRSNLALLFEWFFSCCVWVLWRFVFIDRASAVARWFQQCLCWNFKTETCRMFYYVINSLGHSVIENVPP